MNKQTINNYTEKKHKGEYKGFIDESSTYKTLPEKEVLLNPLKNLIIAYKEILEKIHKMK